ncbi:MAG: SH3 domain-containing protein [Chloroflexi bacterium]|nr:SH3 domain-containing protein [Chloroflexota bacterium]
MKMFPLLLLFALSAIAPAGTLAQGGDCPPFIMQALDAVDDLCAETARNQACYGNLRLNADAQPDAPAFTFEQPGDIADLSGIAALNLSPYDAANEEWGVALLRLQANLPDTLPGQNITMLLFGDTSLSPAPPLTEVTLSVAGGGSINVRAAPSQTAAVVTTLAGGAAVTANGRTAAGDWLRLALDDGTSGWAAAFLFAESAEVETLAVVGADDAVYAPNQAFYFRSGTGQAPCAQAPEDGLLIQTPEGAERLTFVLNGVQIELGSTLYIQAVAGDAMVASVLEGSASVSAFGVTRLVPAGMRITIILDINGLAAAPPNEPQPYDPTRWGVLPLGWLPIVIVITPLEGSCIVTADSAANLRSGPGTVYAQSGTLQAGATALATGQALDSSGATWLQIGAGRWLRADLVQGVGCDGLPLVRDLPPTPSVPPTNPPPQGTATTLWIINPDICEPTNTFPYGSDITVGYGMGYDTEAAANAGLADPWGLTANGVPIPSVSRYIEANAGAPFAIQNLFYWGIPEPGTYTLVATDRAWTQTCVVTITP